jgi:non-ribosomal peptide synthetase component F
MIYTSGTTGVPKAVPLTHGNIIAETGAVEEAMGFSEREVILSLLAAFSRLLPDRQPLDCDAGRGDYDLYQGVEQ